MIRVGLARTQPSYAGLSPPWSPGEAYPEWAAWGGPHGAPNHVYAAVRAALAALGLDAERFGQTDWNPLATLVPRGARIVLKPNLIRHFNPAAEGSLESVVTHGAVLRAAADYAWLAVGSEGSVAIAEAPQHDCEWEVVSRAAGLAQIVDFQREHLGVDLEIVDLRREAVVYRDGVIAERRPLPGDPRGYRRLDLGSRSAFQDSGLDPSRFRGADYDAQPTTDHHRGGRHEYLLSETVLGADLVVNLPKLKTHKKTGVTLALKNLVGINGDKNWLPHHCVGPTTSGGDEFPGGRPVDRLRSAATELARGLLKRGFGTGIVRAVRRAENAVRGEDFIRSGNWHGNRTTWRMCLDLNRCFYYSDSNGEHFDAPDPVRTTLTLLDGVVAGEGEGPLAPSDRPLGAVLAALDPVALDLVAVRLMGFDPSRIPKIHAAMQAGAMRITGVRQPEDVVVAETRAGEAGATERSLDEIETDRTFLPHAGWRGHVEMTACAA